MSALMKLILKKYFTLSKWNIWNSVGILEQKIEVLHHQRQTGPNSGFLMLTKVKVLIRKKKIYLEFHCIFFKGTLNTFRRHDDSYEQACPRFRNKTF